MSGQTDLAARVTQALKEAEEGLEAARKINAELSSDLARLQRVKTAIDDGRDRANRELAVARSGIGIEMARADKAEARCSELQAEVERLNGIVHASSPAVEEAVVPLEAVVRTAESFADFLTVEGALIDYGSDMGRETIGEALKRFNAATEGGDHE